MTAFNAFTQGECAFFLADTAITALTGELIDSAEKLVVFAAARIVIGWTGYSPLNEGYGAGRVMSRLADRGIAANHPDQDDVLAALPGVLREMHDENLAMFRAADEDQIEDRAALAMLVAYSRAADGEPVIMAANTHPPAGLPACELFRLRHQLSTDGPIDSAAYLRSVFGRVPVLEDPRQFNARRDGLALLEHQRRAPPPPLVVRPLFGGRKSYPHNYQRHRCPDLRPQAVAR